jgi:hypothetical protein
MQSGADYQNRVAAWLATKMLAERDACPIAPSGTVVYLRSETREAIDDLLVATDQDNFGFIQAKRRLTTSKQPKSELASVFSQCIRQFLHPNEPELRPWSRILRPDRDKFLLVTSSDTSEQLRKDLATVLERIATLAPQQVLEDAAQTKKEKSALRIAIGHVEREWKTETGNNPTPDQTKAILSLLRIVTLDVEDGDVHERESIGDLRAHVLEDSSQEHLAWTSVVAACKRTAILRSGINLSQLRNTLRGDHIRLQHELAYRSDISKLQKHTTDALNLLNENAEIKLPSRNIKVSREIVSELAPIKPLPSFVIVGPPGAGKSGVLHDLACNLRDAGNDVVCLAVDRLELLSAARLRDEVGLSSHLIDVLKHWDGDNQGYLIIDAFDAARGETAAGTLLDLIQQAQSTSRWRVIIAVRKYDLRYSARLRKLFPNAGVFAFVQTHIDNEFARVSHIKVDAFTADEFNQCCSRWDALDQLRTVAPPKLQELLHTPFNLRLAAELLDSGTAPSDFAGLHGQTGLLKAYWQIRVEYSPGSGLRERVLRQAVASMVSTRRLRTERQVLTESAQALEELLKSNVLSEWQASSAAQPTRQLVSFSHNVLFDFAAEQIYLPYESDAFVSLLVSNPDLAIVLRPSLHMRLRLFWDTDRGGFWALTFQLCATNNLSPLIQSVPLAVVAEGASKHQDVAPLSRELMNLTGSLHKSASIAYRHLVGILISERPENLPNLGRSAGPWSALAADATLHTQFEQIVSSLNWIETSFGSWHARTPQQAHDIGLVARRILTFAWAEQNRNSALVTAGIRAVCKTIESDVTASVALLRKAFQLDHLQKYGHEELQWIVRSASSILEFDASFVADLYKAAFSWREEAQDETALGSTSRLIGFKSNKRQDYQQALWELGQQFQKLLETDVSLATDVIVTVVSHHSIYEHGSTGQTEVFELDGIPSGLKTDYSAIWGNHYGDFGSEPISMLHSYFKYLDEQILSKGAPLPREILEILVGQGTVGVLWRQTLELALKHDALRYQLRSAAWTKPLLVGYDTEKLMFRFVQAVYPTLSNAERAQAEDAIMDIPIRIKGSTFGPETRDRYLGAVEGHPLQTIRAKRQQTRLRNAKLLRLNAPEEFQMMGGAMPPPPPEVLYGWRGVDTQSPANKRLIELQRPLREFSGKHMNVNQVPTLEDAAELLPDMEEMWCALDDGGPSLPHQDVLHESFALLIQAASKIAQVPNLNQQQKLADFVERTVLTGSTTLWPEVDEEQNAKFDAQGGWGSPSGRVEAAEGVMYLITEQRETRLLEHPTFQRLLNDPSALVRSRISSSVLRLYEHERDAMWKLIERFAHDKSVQVRKSVVIALSELARPQPERALRLMSEILERADVSQEGTDDLRRLAVQYLTQYYVWRGDKTAKESVLKLASGLPKTKAEASNMTFPLRHGMMARETDERTEEEALAVRERAVHVFTLLIDQTTSILKPLLQTLSEKRDLYGADQALFRDMVAMALNLSRELYFAVGAFQENRPNAAPKVETPEQVWLYQAIGERWDKLAAIGEAQIAHSLTQSLEMFVPNDPETIFLRIGAILRASKAWGYHYEQMGFDLVLRIFTTYLAEHPEIFQGNPECLRIMRETLELFINVGWVAAHRLAYRLDDLFR